MLKKRGYNQKSDERSVHRYVSEKLSRPWRAAHTFSVSTVNQNIIEIEGNHLGNLCVEVI